MHLSKLTISNFRRIKNATFEFIEGLNVIVGANNIGKTALVDALRSLLASHEDPYLRITDSDIHRPKDGSRPAGDIVFEFVFSGLNESDEADFLHALVPVNGNRFEAHFGVRFSKVDASGRMRINRWCGEQEDIGVTSDMLENLRGVYLQPLRDASKGLKPGRNSQLARLMRLLGEDDKESVEGLIRAFEKLLKRRSPFISTDQAITDRHNEMLGEQLAQGLQLGVSGTDFRALSSKLSISTDGMDVESNGLGFNNLIFMAVVLSEMIKDPTAAYRGLIVEEPEAHLHPQLQVVLLEYLKNIKASDQEGAVQLFVTSHSPNFASLAELKSISCLVEREGSISSFSPRNVQFSASHADHEKRVKKLERYLDVTKAELFFARKLILVEGAAELMLVNVIAKRLGYDLNNHAVSVISVDGLNFDCFLPLMGEGRLNIPVAVLTDADPSIEDPDGSKTKKALYPSLDDELVISDNTILLKRSEDSLVKVFHGVKTFEYDLAIHEENIEVMLGALSEIHPRIASSLNDELKLKSSGQEKAATLFCGMFERGAGKTNVQKGRFSQELSHQLTFEGVDFKVPKYLEDAIRHVCETG